MKRMVLIPVIMIAVIAASGAQDLLERCTGVSTQAQADIVLREIDKTVQYNRDLLRGIVYHNLANAGGPQGEQYVKMAKTGLSRLRTADAAARGYYGSALTIEAGFAFRKNDIVSATALIREGFDELDAAVRSAPDSLLLRILRIENSLAVSSQSPFKRDAEIAVDVEYLSKQTPSSPEVGAKILFYRGECANLRNDLDAALGFYEKAVKAAPGSGTAQRALNRLYELEE